MDLHVGLTVDGRGIGLRLLGRNRGVAANHLGHHATEGLNAQGQRSDVQQQDVLNLTGQNTTLNRSADGDDFIGVDRLVGVLAGDALDQLVKHWRDAGGTTHHHDFIQFTGGELGVLERCSTGMAQRSISLEASSSNLARVRVRSRCLGPREPPMNGRLISFGGVGQPNLGLLSGFSETLQSLLVLTQVDALVGLERLRQVVDDHLVEVVTTEVGVTRG